MYKMLNRYFRFNKIIKFSLWKSKEFDKLQYSKKVLNVVLLLEACLTILTIEDGRVNKKYNGQSASVLCGSSKCNFIFFYIYFTQSEVGLVAFIFPTLKLALYFDFDP